VETQTAPAPIAEEPAIAPAPAPEPTPAPTPAPEPETIKKEEPVAPKPAEPTSTEEPATKEKKRQSRGGRKTVPPPATEPVTSEPEPTVKPESIGSEDPLERYVKQTADILDRIPDTDLHDALRNSLENILDHMENQRIVPDREINEFLRLKKIGERHSGIEFETRAEPITRYKGTTAERYGHQGTVFNKDGKKIGSFELLKGDKVRFSDIDGNRLKDIQISEGQWNDKALSGISKEIFDETTPPPINPPNPPAQPSPAPTLPPTPKKPTATPKDRRTKSRSRRKER
jgi:hypothetical protein